MDVRPLVDLQREDRERGMRYCRGCGCTDAFACEGGCSWAEPGLCSTCAEAAS